MGLKFFMYCSYRTSPVGSLLPIEPAYHACHTPPSHPTSPTTTTMASFLLPSQQNQPPSRHHGGGLLVIFSPCPTACRLVASARTSTAQRKLLLMASTRSPHLRLGCFVRHARRGGRDNAARGHWRARSSRRVARHALRRHVATSSK